MAIFGRERKFLAPHNIAITPMESRSLEFFDATEAIKVSLEHQPYWQLRAQQSAQKNLGERQDR
jgi:hypothetical protein